MSVTEQTIEARRIYNERGWRIILEGFANPTPSAQMEFIRTLPNWMHYRPQHSYSCDATPASATRIINEGWAANELRDLAASMAPQKSTSHEQPITRIHDAWGHQNEAYSFAFHRPATMLAMDMGTGKSKVACDLIVNWGCKSTLILCPKTVLGVWRREIAKHAPGLHGATYILDGKQTTAKKAEMLQRWTQRQLAAGQPRVVVVNYDSAWRGDLGRLLLGDKWDCIILDESHRIKSHGSQVSKWCAKLGRKSARRLCLTGTPMDTPLDAYGQYRFLDAGVFGTSYTWFRDRYAICGIPTIPNAVTGYKNEDELAKRFAWLAYQVKADDVLDLPNAIHEQRAFKLAGEAAKFYRDMEEGLIAEIDNGIISTAANALVKLLRLSQATGGMATDDESKATHRLAGGDGKARLLADILEDAGSHEPVVVFCQFTADLEAVRNVANKLKRRYGEVSGHQKDLTELGTMPEDVDVLGVQIQAGGVGVDLTRARIAVCYSVGASLLAYKQLLARVHRPGQTRPVVYYHLIAEGTVDEQVYRALDKKENVVEAVFAAMKERV